MFVSFRMCQQVDKLRGRAPVRVALVLLDRFDGAQCFGKIKRKHIGGAKQQGHQHAAQISVDVKEGYAIACPPKSLGFFDNICC